MRRLTRNFSLLFFWVCLSIAPSLSAAGLPGESENLTVVVNPEPQTGGGHTVSLAWDPSLTAGVAYNVYSGTATGQETTKLTATPIDSACATRATCVFTDTSAGLLAGAKFFYVVKAVQPDGTESAPSNEVSAQIPFPVPAAPGNLAVTGKT
jgi:fibronectin type 3 domain-containing protein